MLTYLDNCYFNRPSDNQSHIDVVLEIEAKLVVQNKVRHGELKLAWSYIMDFENDANPFQDRKISIGPWRMLASVDTDVSEAVVARAEKLCEVGIREKDALHVSCAIEAGCSFFLTTDRGILKKSTFVTDLLILSPVDYVSHYDD